MEWQTLQGGFTMATVAKGEPLDVAMLAFCRQIQEQVIPQNHGVLWDHVRVEIWADSGRLIAFPARRLERERIEKSGCQVVFDELRGQYEELADSDMADDAFTDALTRVQVSWIERFVTAAKSGILSGLRVQFWDSDGEAAIREVTI